jgi:hypothetical protein
VADELNRVAFKGGIAKDMIRVDMRIDDVAYRQRSDFAYRCVQCLSDLCGSTRVDHCNAFASDHKADVGDIAMVRAGRIFLVPDVHIDSIGDANHCQRL